MFELGKKKDIFGAELLEPVSISGRPKQMPALPSNKHSLICGYDQGLGERLIVCENLEDMQALYDAYYQGRALRINWYIGEDVGVIQDISAGITPE